MCKRKLFVQNIKSESKNACSDCFQKFKVDKKLNSKKFVIIEKLLF